MLSDCSVLIATLCCLFSMPKCTCKTCALVALHRTHAAHTRFKASDITFPKLPAPSMTGEPFSSLIHRNLSYWHAVGMSEVKSTAIP
jgi:hypothetical protein